MAAEPPRPLGVRRLAEAVTYIGLSVGIAGAAAMAVGLGLATSYGCGWLRGVVIGKTLLFFLGFGLMAYGAVLLRPSRVDSGETEARSFWGVSTGRSGSNDSHASGSGSTSSRRRSGTGELSDGGETRFTRLVMGMPPARSVHLAREDRLSPGTKTLLAGGVLLALTAVMEFGFGLYAVPC